jgi:hypothetical protein
MGILNQLQNQGSVYAYGANSVSPTYGNNAPYGPQSPLVTPQSQLHATPNGSPGYSLNGSNGTTVNSYSNIYQDGVLNALPSPSTLDMNGTNPTPYLLNPPQ